jgi:alkylation response protein AidB-like acyl-CoA dehydrogenase
MDLDLNTPEKLVLQKLENLLAAHMPAAPVYGGGDLDAPLLRGLAEAGLLSFAAEGPQGRVQAMLVIHEVSRANGIIPIGVQAMLGPVIAAGHPGRLIAVKNAGRAVPVRFAAQAELLVVLGTEVAAVFELQAGDAKPEPTHYGYPFARVDATLPGAAIGSFAAELILRRWQLGLAGEITGALAGALGYLVAYLSQREQFDRKLGAFQAIQHRLSELAVTLEAARHLALEAAWSDRAEAAAMAAYYAADAARKMCLEAHQLSGAQGFTLDAGLYAWTLRLHALSLEAGGARWHAAVAAAQLWPSSDDHAPVVGGHNGSYNIALETAPA